MTQALGATRRPQRLRPGMAVRHRRDETWTGQVTAPDDFYATLRLRGVSERSQVLVHWPEAGLCTWELLTDLEAAP